MPVNLKSGIGCDSKLFACRTLCYETAQQTRRRRVRAIGCVLLAYFAARWSSPVSHALSYALSRCLSPCFALGLILRMIGKISNQTTHHLSTLDKLNNFAENTNSSINLLIDFFCLETSAVPSTVHYSLRRRASAAIVSRTITKALTHTSLVSRQNGRRALAIV